MAQTIKTRAALIAQLADNTAGAISPEDLRDFLVSIMGVYGSIYTVAGSTTQALTAATPVQLQEWSGDGPAVGVTPGFATDKVTVDEAGTYEIDFDVSFEGITNAVQEFTLYVNGSPASPAHSCRRKTSNADVGNAGFNCHLTLAAADILSIWVESTLGAPSDITVVEAHLIAHRMA